MKCLAVLILAVMTGSAGAFRVEPALAVARALEVSDAAFAAELRADAAARTVAAADAALFPTLSVSASAAYRSSVPEFSITIPVPGLTPMVLAPDIREVYATGLRMQQVLFSGGAVTGARRAARHELEAGRQIAAQIRADVRLQALSVYWSAVRAGAALRAAEAQERRAQRLHTDAGALDDAGMATPADLAAARERIASATVQRIRTAALSDNAHAQLRSLLHLDPGTPIELADSLDGPLPPLPESLESLQDHALRSRPELAASRSRVRVLEARRAIAGAGSWPSLSAVTQWDYSRPNQRYFPTEDAWNDSWSVGIVGAWNVFDGGKARADARSLEAAARGAARDLAELQRLVLLEVETAHRDLCSAIATIAAAEAALDAAGQRQRQTGDRFAAGLAAIADQLDAEAQLQAAEGMVIDAHSGAWIAAARLDRAVGR